MLTSCRSMSPTPSTAPTPSTTSSKPETQLTSHSSMKSASRSGIEPRASIDTKRSALKHQNYIDSLIPPSPDTLERISTAQQRKEEEWAKKRTSEDNARPEEDRIRAAGLIQRNYRGHRERRVLDGKTLDPSTRWIEALKEARYRNLTTPRARAEVAEKVRRSFDGGGTLSSGGEVSEGPTTGTDGGTSRNSTTIARQNWKKIAMIARRAGGDEDSDSDDEEDGSDQDCDAVQAEKMKQEKRGKRIEQRVMRQKAAKIMDLQYFLEMVDLKHRYGSNLRTYHTEWRKADTKENFFYWLDYGEGKFIDCQGCPRERLNREQVRYLSKEERLHYLVKVDEEGRLCWAKNGVRIDTTTKFKDSIHGIVPDTDNTPAYAPPAADSTTVNQDDGDSFSSSEDSDEAHKEDSRAKKNAPPEVDEARGMKKVKHISAATIFNKLLRGSVKKNTWIFVADTHFRLYVGIKQSGAFQHSSFLHGSRISAAGLVKINHGLLTKLSPLSGHYRPPTANFKAFIPSLRESGVDMSHVTISRSYAVLLGLEAYLRSRRRGKEIMQQIMHHRDNILSPELELEEMEKREARERQERFRELKAKALAEDQPVEREHGLRRKLHMRAKHDCIDLAHGDESDQRQSGSGSGPVEEDREIENVNAPGNVYEEL